MTTKGSCPTCGEWFEFCACPDRFWHHHGHGETESRGGRKVGQYGGHSHVKGDEPHVHSIFGKWFPGGQDPDLKDGCPSHEED